jgi:hypothetical protein
MGSYSGEIDFSGKAIIIWGQGKVLDASGGSRFFIGEGAGSFLELHDAVLQNGYAVHVSGWSSSHHAVLELFCFIATLPTMQVIRIYSEKFPELSAPISGGGHATCRAELF